MKNSSYFRKGVAAGAPIGIGYLSVSFGFGIIAVKSGVTAFDAFIISLTNLTSAGQAEGINVIAAGGTLLEMALVQLVINIRYSLMALSLSQNMDESFTLRHRLLAAYGITDEIFALCSTSKEPIRPAYMYGMISVATLGWVTGTLLGATAGEVLPVSLTSALGIMLYGMFIAIIIPPAAKEKSILFVVILAAVLSCLCHYLLPMLSGGFAMILCAMVTALAGALLFPVKDDSQSGGTDVLPAGSEQSPDKSENADRVRLAEEEGAD